MIHIPGQAAFSGLVCQYKKYSIFFFPFFSNFDLDWYFLYFFNLEGIVFFSGLGLVLERDREGKNIKFIGWEGENLGGGRK